MTIMKRILLVLTAAVMSLPLYCCSDDKTEETTTEAQEQASDSAEESTEAAGADDVQSPIPMEYDGSEVPEGAAEAVEKYFRAIMNQNYEEYKSCLDPYYFDVYNTWLDGSFGYGMETSFETMHQTLMDAACAADTEDGVVKEAVITKLKLTPSVPMEGEESVEDMIESYLDMYDQTIGEGFSEGLRQQCDEIITVAFTMVMDCDGTEYEVMTEMELLMTVKDGVYYITG